MSYSEVLQVNVRQSTDAQVQVQWSEEVEELEGDDGGQATPYTGHSGLAGQLSQTELTDSSHKLLSVVKPGGDME